MLLLSSATRIFASGGPPGTWTPRPAPVCPHTVPPSYWSTANKVRQRRQISRVSEVDTSERPVRNCLSGCDLPAAFDDYQGMIFLIPFFFLLVDSVPLSLAAGCAASVFAASAAGAVAAAGAFGSASAEADGAAAFGSESVVAGCASVAGTSTVDPPAAPLPGVATSMTAVLPAGLERKMQLTCSSHRPPGATADNPARCGGGKSPQSFSFRFFKKCRPASRAPGQSCCTADPASSPPANAPPRRDGRPSRNSSSRCDIRLLPKVLAL